MTRISLAAPIRRLLFIGFLLAWTWNAGATETTPPLPPAPDIFPHERFADPQAAQLIRAARNSFWDGFGSGVLQKPDWVAMAAIDSRIEETLLISPPIGIEARVPAGFEALYSGEQHFRCNPVTNMSPLYWTLPPFEAYGPNGRRLIFINSAPEEVQRLASLILQTLPDPSPQAASPAKEVTTASGKWTWQEQSFGSGDLAQNLISASIRRIPNRELRILAISPIPSGSENPAASDLNTVLDSILWLNPPDWKAQNQFDDFLCNYALSNKSDDRINTQAAGLVEKYPDFPLAHALKAALLLRSFSNQEALAAAKEGLAHQPNNSTLIRLAYEAALRAWDPALVRELGPQVIALFPYQLNPVLTNAMTADVTGDGIPDILRFEPREGQLEQYDGATHQLLWKSGAFGSISPFAKNLRRGYWPTFIGYNQGPIFLDINGDGADDLIFTNQYSYPDDLVAIDRKSGKEIWRRPLKSRVREGMDLLFRGNRLLVLERKGIATNPPNPADDLLIIDPKTGDLIAKQVLTFDKMPQLNEPQSIHELLAPTRFSFWWPTRRITINVFGKFVFHQQPPLFPAKANPSRRTEAPLATDTRFLAQRDRLFIAEGTRLLALDLKTGAQLWEWTYPTEKPLGNIVLTPGAGYIQLLSVSGELADEFYLARLSPSDGKLLREGTTKLDVPDPRKFKDLVERPRERDLVSISSFDWLILSLSPTPPPQKKEPPILLMR